MNKHTDLNGLVPPDSDTNTDASKKPNPPQTTTTVDTILEKLKSSLNDLHTRYYKREIPDIMTFTDLQKLEIDDASAKITALIRDAKTMTKSEFVELASERVEDHFPKGKATMRGEAMILVAMICSDLLKAGLLTEDMTE